MKFVEVEQDGKIAQVNPEYVVMIVPDSLIGVSNLAMTNGMLVKVKGSVSELTARLTGQSLLDL